jgi:glycine dehydrogenase
MARLNQRLRSYLGLGYSATLTPPVIQRNVFENPGWYTAYTPYQAEISQGRLEALLVFQTMVQDLTGMEIANASMLDEATAAAEAMTMSHRITRGKRNRYLVDANCHPQTVAVVKTRAEPLGLEVIVADLREISDWTDVFGALLQYPGSDGAVVDWRSVVQVAHDAGALVTFATDLLALALLESPGTLGADIVVGNSQRFGVPLGFGGPHAAFLATTAGHKRQVPGRIIGVAKDARGQQALRMALQTREQHIRRERATSNICTAQVLLAVMAGLYAVWHGPQGIRRIARRVHGFTSVLRHGLVEGGLSVAHDAFFDTLRVVVADADAVCGRAYALGINLRVVDANSVVVALDETVVSADLVDLFHVFSVPPISVEDGTKVAAAGVPDSLRRTTDYLTSPVFQRHHSESEMMRFLHRLEARDLTLNTSMIPLGSCTMKLNAASELMPVSFPGFGQIHPYAPLDQVAGYLELFETLEAWLAEITGFAAVSLQPNAGSQGEYAGLLAIRAFHAANGQTNRRVCLIPKSAHGTNPASAVMAGMKVVVVACDDSGNIDVEDLRAKARSHAEDLAALMVTYPSTHGVFEAAITEMCEIVHDCGGQIYMDGANMNAMVGLCRPGDFGADVCHLNLHKTFSIPHGGGGPGVGPIGVAAHLAPFLPPTPVSHGRGDGVQGTVSAAPWGSAGILPISWAYIAMMGGEGLTHASRVAILNANYVAHRLEEHFPVLYRGGNGFVGHECILELRHFKRAGVTVDDVAKRLMDFGFHAPTMSFPVAGTLMVEPTESESLPELDRFCDAMIAIREEIRMVESGEMSVEDSPLRHAPHTLDQVAGETWDRCYSRDQAGFPAPWTREHKYWPYVARIDNAFGDKNLICSCAGLEAYETP